MARGVTGAIPRDARTFAFGLILGFGGVEYPPSQIAKIVNERFGVEVKAKTVSNWKSSLPAQMERYGITEADCREAAARGLVGDQRNREDIEEVERELPREEKITRGQESETGREPGETETPIRPLTFSNTAEVISYCEGQGFIVGKDLEDIKVILAANNISVVDNAGETIGVEDIFITPIELDIEVVGRNIVANPIIGFYYAYERRNDPSLDLAVWITNKLVELYSNLDKIYEDQKPVILAVLRG